MFALEFDGLEVPQLSQVPQLDHRVLARRRQVVAILRERETRDRARVAREIGQIRLGLEVPDLDGRVGRARAEDETVRMEFGARERHRTAADAGRLVGGRGRCRRHLDEHLARADVREGPVLVERAGEQVVAERVQRDAAHGRLVYLEELNLLSDSHRPDANGRVGAGRYHDVLSNTNKHEEMLDCGIESNRTAALKGDSRHPDGRGPG